MKLYIHRWIFLFNLAFSLFPISSFAEMYKWIDGNGKVQYSDAKPKTGSVNDSQIKLNQPIISTSSLDSIPQVATRKPITNISGDAVKSVQLEKILIDLTDSTSARTIIGADFTGDTCSKKSQDLVVTARRTQLEDVNAEKKIREIFSAQHYKYVGKRDAIFAGQQSESAELSLAAIINEIKVRICHKGNRNTKVNVETYLKIEWQLFDLLDRHVVYKSQTEGYDRNDYDNLGDSAGSAGKDSALANALINLLADNNFVQHLHKADHHPQISSDNSLHLKIVNQPIQPSTNFVDHADVLQNSVVTVRTTTGHGTGFYISHDGYILTNAHVVNEAKTVLIINKDRQYKADVVRKDQQRDIALLKSADPITAAPLSLSSQPIKLGETIYVIGTPLDEKLEHTITSGIISASRINEEGQIYYQTDAALNHGNSGGPAFSRKGEVIGIAVSALFSREGANQSINFLIPIDDALSKLNIGY